MGDVDAAVVLHAASAEKRDDEDIVLAAVARFPKAVQFVSKRLRADARVLHAIAAAEAALQRDLVERSLGGLRREPSRKHSSPSATATAASYRLSDPSDEAMEWQTFSHEVTATDRSSETSEFHASHQEEAHSRSSSCETGLCTNLFGLKQRC